MSGVDHWEIDGPPLCVRRCGRDAILIVDDVDALCGDCVDELLGIGIADGRVPLALLAAEEREQRQLRLVGPQDKAELDSDELRAARRRWLDVERHTYAGIGNTPEPGSRAGRRTHPGSMPPVTRVEPHEGDGSPSRPAGQLSLLADEV